MEKLGYRGQAHTLLSSYFSNRTQTTKVKNNDQIFLSQQGTVTCGIPQGTVLAPFYFSLYINDLLTLKLNGQINAFADDTILICRSTTRSELYETANEDFQKIQSWMNDNLLTLNMSKTNYLELKNTKHKLTQNKYSIATINEVEHTKYLGIIIDNNCNWKKQINNVVTKLRKTIYKFVQLRNIVNENLLKTIYYAIVHSNLQYGIIAWGTAFKNETERLAKVQKKS